MSKLAFVLPNWATIDREGVVFYSELAEDLGYDSIWVPETWGNDAFTLLTIIAHNTNSLKFGSGIVSVYSRSPAVMAQTIATIDLISNGRSILGLGSSTSLVNENWHGVKHDRPLQRTREYVEIIRLILSGERVNYEGEIFTLRNFRLQSNPVRRNVPIYLASLGPKNLQMTGEVADGWLPFLCPVDHLIKLRDVVEKSSLKAGRDVEDVSVYPYVPALVSDDQEQANYRLKEFIAFYVGAMGPYYNRLVSGYGFETDASGVKEAWSRRDTEAAVKCVSDELMNTVSINGLQENALEKLRVLWSEVDCPVLIFPFKVSREQIVETLTKLAPKRLGN